MDFEDLKELGWAIIWPIYKPIAYQKLLKERKERSIERENRRVLQAARRQPSPPPPPRPKRRPEPSDGVWSTRTRRARFDDVRSYYNKYRTICNVTGEDFLTPEDYVLKAKDYGWAFLEKSVLQRTTYRELRNFGG